MMGSRFFELGGEKVEAFLFQAIHELRCRAGREVVDTVDLIDDQGSRGDHHTDRTVEEQANIVDRPDGRGVGGGEHDRVAVTPDGQ
jgi:hypothetical protein